MADTKLSAMTELTSLSSTDQFYVTPLVTGTRRDRRMTAANLATGVASLLGLSTDKTNDKIVVFPSHNASDSTISTITGAGSASYPNLIGTTGKPVAATWAPTGWADDSGYVAASAQVAGILSGYDHVVNCLAGTVCGGGHNFIKYSVQGHNIVGGGSYNIINGGYSGIFSGRRNSISGGPNANFNFIGSGDDNEIASPSSYACIGTGLSNDILSTGTYGFIGSGTLGVVSGGFGVIVSGNGNTSSGDYAAILSGNACTASGAYSMAHGNGATASGAYSAAIGRDMSAANPFAYAFGRDGVSRGAGTITLAKTKLVEVGDAQVVSLVQAVRTSGATLTNMTSVDGDLFTLPAGKVSAGTCRVLLTAMRDGSADGNNDSDYTQASYSLEFGFFWNGTNGFLFSSATQTSVAASPTLDLSALSANTNNDFAPGAAPHVAINSGALRVKVTGIAATAINWVARLDMALTLVS